MNINVTLKRAADGRLRPDLAPPTTPSEAKAFQEAMGTAREAQALLDTFTATTEKLKTQDGKEEDLNGDPGIVATSRPYRSSESRDKVTRSEVLTYDTASGQMKTYNLLLEGTVFRTDGTTASSAGRDYNSRETAGYTASPLFSLEQERLLSLPSDSSKFYKVVTLLNETSPGVYAFARTEESTIF